MVDEEHIFRPKTFMVFKVVELEDLHDYLRVTFFEGVKTFPFIFEPPKRQNSITQLEN